MQIQKEDLAFLTIFCAVLLSVSYLLGDSITGYVTQTMYCTGESCKDFCRFDNNCPGLEVCCQKDGFGVCEMPEACSQHFIFQGERFSPAQTNVWIYSILIIGIIAFVIIYFLRKQKQEKKILHKKRKK